MLVKTVLSSNLWKLTWCMICSKGEGTIWAIFGLTIHEQNKHEVKEKMWYGWRICLNVDLHFHHFILVRFYKRLKYAKNTYCKFSMLILLFSKVSTNVNQGYFDWFGLLSKWHLEIFKVFWVKLAEARTTVFKKFPISAYWYKNLGHQIFNHWKVICL